MKSSKPEKGNESLATRLFFFLQGILILYMAFIAMISGFITIPWIIELVDPFIDGSFLVSITVATIPCWYCAAILAVSMSIALYGAKIILQAFGMKTRQEVINGDR